MKKREVARKKKRQRPQLTLKPGTLYYSAFAGIHTSVCVIACFQTKVTDNKLRKLGKLMNDLKMRHQSWEINFAQSNGLSSLTVTFMANSGTEIRTAVEEILDGSNSLLRESLTPKETPPTSLAA